MRNKRHLLLITAFLSFAYIFAQKNVAMYWDASYSMKDRQIDKEIKFLDNYFKKFTEANVLLTVFSNDIQLKQTFTVEEGDWEALKAELKQTIYDGATSYANLFQEEVEEYLLFSDGNENLDTLNPPYDKPIHIITSVDHVNMNKLKTTSRLSNGRFFYLNPEQSRSAEVVQTETKNTSVNDGFVTGSITGDEGPLPNVSVVNQTSNKGIASSSTGKFKIEADDGDILIFSFLGKKTVSIRVGDFNVVDVYMNDVNESLDEVVLTAEQEKAETVNTGNTRVDKKRLGYAVQEISSDDISSLDTDLNGVVNGQFSNFEIPNQKSSGDTQIDVSQFLGRGKNMTILLNQYGLIVVDGVPLGQTESNFGGIKFDHDNIINPDMIASVTYLKGLAATNKYGTIGRNGVLLITTKNAEVLQGTEPEKKTELLGTTDTYVGDAETMSALPNTPYFTALKDAKSVNQAFGYYLLQREKFGDDPIFYLDVADYFNGWNNPLITERILSNVYEMAYDNPKALRALAYKQQQYGLYNTSIITHKRLIELNPDHSQPYRDLALAYTYTGQNDEALKVYKNIDNYRNVGNANFQGIKKTVNNEAKSLIAIHKNELNTLGMNPVLLKPNTYKSRIVFEWNNLDAQFDLNIINPQNRFFTLSHTTAENSQNILQQKQQGYAIEEFYLTQDDVGEWKFNVKYYGNGTDDPTFVKITTYKNFGSPSQTKEIKVVRLDKTNVEQTVKNLMVSN